ncbi:MAG: GFA family protein [Proteobacteria bacterium]|nr:GFA family protein [Pseudomonadota bacterium]
MQQGGCQCGEIRYQSEGQPIALYICHCRECQKQSASAFGISLDVNRANFCITQGKPKYWFRTTDSGRKLKCAFCPTCGSRLWHEYESGAHSETVSIKAGSLDQPLDVSNAIHVWVSRKLPGILIPHHAKQFPED